MQETPNGVQGMSLESFEEAAAEALGQLPAGPEGFRRGRIVSWWVESGGWVERTQYHVKMERME